MVHSYMEPNPVRTRLHSVRVNAVATGVLLLVGLSACGDATPSEGQAVAVSGQVDSTTPAPPSPTPVVSEPAKSAPDPRNHLPVGAAGTLRIHTHCGLRYALIDGRTWETDAIGNGAPPAAADGNEDIAGFVSRPAANLVTFEFESAGSMRTVLFKPATVDASYICY